jgi:hypothetical protein
MLPDDVAIGVCGRRVGLDRVVLRARRRTSSSSESLGRLSLWLFTVRKIACYSPFCAVGKWVVHITFHVWRSTFYEVQHA